MSKTPALTGGSVRGDLKGQKASLSKPIAPPPMRNPTKVAHETTTKKCPNCGNTMLARMPSLNTKKCTDCGKWLVWELDKGQSSPYTDMRNFD